MASARTVRDVMTTEVVTLPMDASVRQAATEMRDHDIGDVLVVDGDTLCGVVTDRDLVVRVVAENGDLDATLGDVCSSGELVTARPDTSVEEVVTMLREAAVRRVPVVDDQQHPVGMVSIGDLAILEDSRSALADISAAPPNT